MLIQKVIDSVAALEVVKKHVHLDSRAPKDGLAAKLLRVDFDVFAYVHDLSNRDCGASRGRVRPEAGLLQVLAHEVIGSTGSRVLLAKLVEGFAGEGPLVLGIAVLDGALSVGGLQPDLPEAPQETHRLGTPDDLPAQALAAGRRACSRR